MAMITTAFEALARTAWMLGAGYVSQNPCKLAAVRLLRTYRYDRTPGGLLVPLAAAGYIAVDAEDGMWEINLATIDATGATFIDFFDVVCPSSTCTTGIGSSWTYRDFEHLSFATSKSLASAFRDVANELLPGPDEPPPSLASGACSRSSTQASQSSLHRNVEGSHSLNGTDGNFF